MYLLSLLICSIQPQAYKGHIFAHVTDADATYNMSEDLIALKPKTLIINLAYPLIPNKPLTQIINHCQHRN